MHYLMTRLHDQNITWEFHSPNPSPELLDSGIETFYTSLYLYIQPCSVQRLGQMCPKY